MNNFFATPEGAWGDGSVHVHSDRYYDPCNRYRSAHHWGCYASAQFQPKKGADPPPSSSLIALLSGLPLSAP